MPKVDIGVHQPFNAVGNLIDEIVIGFIELEWGEGFSISGRVSVDGNQIFLETSETNTDLSSEVGYTQKSWTKDGGGIYQLDP